MCKCVNEINQRFVERGDNVEILTSLFGSQRCFVELEKADYEKRKKGPKRIVANYCPFCGVKYAESESPNNAGLTTGIQLHS